jgi:long-chain acyl-CoA synthetase
MPVELNTLVHLFHECVGRGGARTALFVPSADGSNFTTLTWADLAHEVQRLATGLRRAGLMPGDRIVQVSENRYEWILLDLAVHVARGVHVAVHSVLSGRQIAYQIVNSEARLVVISSNSQAEKLSAAANLLPHGLQYYSYEPLEATIAGQPIAPFTDLLAGIGRDAPRAIAQEALDRTRPDDLATILYTSGTTGEAKGVMLSHKNLASNAQATCNAFEFTTDDLRLSWLPLSHIFARTCDLYTWLVHGCQLAVAASREQIIAHCGMLHPTTLNGVPYFFEKVCQSLTKAKKIGPTEPGGPTHLQSLLGGRMRACCSGGAALPDQVGEFFWREGVPLVQGYGLTESSPVITTCTPDRHKLGTVGPPIEGVEVKIAHDGEILTRGPHVMLGYWRCPADTAEAIRDSWLHTGDLGELDSDGFLKITGRKKELLVTAGGKNIAPAFIEGLLAGEPLIYQALVIGDARKYLTALIVPDPDALRSEIISRRIPVTSAAEALVHPAVLALYRQRIDACLANVSECEQIQRFKLLPRGFTVENEEQTPTLKLRRSVIQEHFVAEIASLYSD